MCSATPDCWYDFASIHFLVRSSGVAMLLRRELGSFVSTVCQVAPLVVMEEWRMSSEVEGLGLLREQASFELQVSAHASEAPASPQDLGSQAGSQGSLLRNLSRAPNTLCDGCVCTSGTL